MNKSWVYVVSAASVLGVAVALHSFRGADEGGGAAASHAATPVASVDLATRSGGWVGRQEAHGAQRSGQAGRVLKGRAPAPEAAARFEQGAGDAPEQGTSSGTTATSPKQVADPLQPGSDEAGTVLSQAPRDPSAPAPGDTAVPAEGISLATPRGATFTTDQLTVLSNGPPFTGQAGAISFWLEPNWIGSDDNNSYFLRLGTPGEDGNQVHILKNLRYLRFFLSDSEGHEHNLGMAIDQWQPGDRHYIATTWADGQQALYVDGGLIEARDFSGQLAVPPRAPLYIGSDPEGANGSSADGRLGNLKIYNRPLTPEEVASAVDDPNQGDSPP